MGSFVEKEKLKMRLVLVLLGLLTAGALAEECQIYRETVKKLALEISSRQTRPQSLSDPDGVCEDGEGWACSGEIASKSNFQKLKNLQRRILQKTSFAER